MGKRGRFDYELARVELEAADRRRREHPLPDDHPWKVLIRQFCEAAEESAKTHIAMLGTAILARATSEDADLLRLKLDKRYPGSYYARALADRVLAPVAPLIGVNLGANGANPLNNSPYRGPASIADIDVRSDIRPLFTQLVGIIRTVDAMSRDEGREALQAFVEVRTRPRAPRVALPAAVGAISAGELARGIGQFVSSNSEGGKRAQAAAAGILDALYGDEAVMVAAVNDPDRRFPGDVAVRDPDRVLWSLEVRDKTVELSGLLQFVEKVASRGVPRAAIIAVAPGQDSLDVGAVERLADELGVSLRFFRSWRAFVEEIVHHATEAPDQVRDMIVQRVFIRAQELNVSERGRSQWRDLSLAMRRR